MTEKKTVFSVTKDDFEFQWFSGTGAGGQHRNKHQNCFRLIHKATGVVKTGQSHRERLKNRREALEAMANDPRFRAYCTLRLSELESRETVEEAVERQMNPAFLQTEVRREGRWVVEDTGA